MATTIPKGKLKVCGALAINVGEDMEVIATNEREYLRMAYLQSGDKRLYDMLAFYGWHGGLPVGRI